MVQLHQAFGRMQVREKLPCSRVFAEPRPGLKPILVISPVERGDEKDTQSGRNGKARGKYAPLRPSSFQATVREAEFAANWQGLDSSGKPTSALRGRCCPWLLILVCSNVTCLAATTFSKLIPRRELSIHRHARRIGDGPTEMEAVFTLLTQLEAIRQALDIGYRQVGSNSLTTEKIRTVTLKTER